MLVSTHRLQHPEPDAGGTGTAPATEPVVDATAAPAAAPAAEPAAPPEPFAGLSDALDAIGADPAAPAQPRVAGKFASLGQRAAGVAAPAQAKAPAATPAPAAGPMPPAPKPGELDLTPPEGMTERAGQRWAQLTERAKLVPQLEQRATEATTALDSVRRLVADSGLQSHEFTEMLEMSRLARSNTRQDAERALQMLDAQRAQLAGRLGIEVPGVDLLAGHPDLQADAGVIMTRERALEIARLRDQNNQAGTTLQQQREHHQHVQTVNSAAASMAQTLESLAGTPGHDAKVNYIKQHLSNPQNMQAFVNTYEPPQWPQVMLAMYHAYTPPPVVATPAVPQPLRPGHGNHGAAVRGGPVTAESAVQNAFAAAGL